MQIVDRFLPEFDLAVVEHVVVEAGTDETFAAIARAELAGDRILRVIGSAREWSEHVAAAQLGIDLPAAPKTLGDLLGTDYGWVELADEPGGARVLGLVARPDPFRLSIEHVTAGGFASFAEPGFARLVAAFTVEPEPAGRTLLGLELRAQATDEETRGYLRSAGFVGRPGAGTVARRALALVKHEAETSHSQDTQQCDADGDHGHAGDLDAG